MATRQRGVGTLLIVVLIVLASLFVMAMMQYFAQAVTKGKRILAHIAVTDYACEAALDEAVLWFKGHANDPKDKDARKLHEKLVDEGKDDATTSYKPKTASELYAKLHKDLKIEDVVITISDVRKINPTEGKLAGKSFFETEGIVNFAVSASYETTRKTAVRSLEFRQVVVAPPSDYSKYQFVATGFGYLWRRVQKYVADQSKYQEVLAKAAERVFFGFSMLTYIAEPSNTAIGPGGNFVVGLTFIRQVRDAANRMGGLDNGTTQNKLVHGMCCDGPAPGQPPPPGPPPPPPTCNPRQCEGLTMWRETYKNANFNVEYVKAMAAADTNNLTKVLDNMKTNELGFQPGDGGPLAPGDEYPLAPKGKDKPAETTAQVLGGGAGYGFMPAKKWGVGGKLKGTMFKPAEINFNTVGKSKITLADVERMKDPPVVVVDKRAGAFKLSELMFFVHPPPVVPGDVKPDKDLQGEAGVEGIDAKCSVTTSDLEELDASGTNGQVLADLAAGKWSSKFPDLEGLKEEDYKVPGLSLWHPKSYEDWAFRFPKSFWKDNFSKHNDAYVKWKDATVKSAKYYKDTMEQKNTDALKTFQILEPKTGPTSTSAKPPTPTSKDLGKRASYVFPTPKDFDDAMKALGKAANQTDSLVMNGVYFVGKLPPDDTPGTPTPAPATGAAKDPPLTLTQGQYIGQGEIVANHLILTAGMKAVPQKGIGMVLHSASDDQPFEINSANHIDASIVTGAILKAKAAATIKGVFVVKDAFCAAASNRADAKDENKEVNYYHRKLPELTIEHPGYAQAPVEYSQMTFSSYRTSSGGARGAK